MIPHPLSSLKIETTDETLTSYSGLTLVVALFHALGLDEHLDASLASLKRRRRGYTPSQFVLALILLHLSGGDHLDDIRNLRGDQGLHALLGELFPAANTLGNFLRAFSHRDIAVLARLVTELANRLLEDRRSVVLDFDSSLIEADKRDAKKTYEGFRGYNPLLVFIDGVEMVLAGVFRDGNASPASHALSFLRRALRVLPAHIEQIRIRSDSAWYRSDVLDYCHRRGVGFTVTVDKTSAMIKTIRRLTDWQPLDPNDPDAGELAQTSYVVGSDPRSPAYRLVVLRTPRDQADLHEGPYFYHGIITNLDEGSPADILRFHRRRGDAENRFKELKGGFGMETMPCGDLLANAAYFQTILLAYNLLQCFKADALPDSWRPLTVKTLRFRLFSLAGRVVHHARQWGLKLPERYPFFDLFVHAFWEVRHLTP